MSEDGIRTADTLEQQCMSLFGRVFDERAALVAERDRLREANTELRSLVAEARGDVGRDNLDPDRWHERADKALGETP